MAAGLSSHTHNIISYIFYYLTIVLSILLAFLYYMLFKDVVPCAFREYHQPKLKG